MLNRLCACQWFNNCLTARHMQAFVSLLAITPLLFVILASPILSIFSTHVSKVYRFSINDSINRRLWWDWWGSWIVFGGPLGRYLVGLILGYSRYPIRSHGLLDGPNGRLAGLVFPGALIALFTIVSSS